MRHKYFLFPAIGIFLSVFFGALAVHAQTPTGGDTLSTLERAIQEIEVQIAVLQTRLNEARGALQRAKETPVAPVPQAVSENIQATLFSRSLALGARGDDVKELQKFLSQFPDLYPEQLQTGFYGPRTAAAVRKFQERHGIENIGSVGPKTLSKISELLTSGAGKSGTVPPGLTTAPGIQKQLAATTTITVATSTCATNYSLCYAKSDCETARFFWYTVSCHPNPPPTYSCAESYSYCINPTECSKNGWYSCRNSCYPTVEGCQGQTYAAPAVPVTPAVPVAPAQPITKTGTTTVSTVSATTTSSTATTTTTTSAVTATTPTVTSATSDRLKWSYTLGNRTDSSPAIALDGTVYIGAYDGKLYALSENGVLKWTYTTGGIINSSPAIGADGIIYVGSYDRKLYALNSDGTLKWAFTAGDNIHSAPAIGSDGTVYFGARYAGFYAVNPDGSQKWSFLPNRTFGYSIPVMSSPAIAPDGSVYFTANDGTLYALTAGGAVKWTVTTSSGSSSDNHSSPAIASDGTIYVASWDKYLYAVNPNGTVKWKFYLERITNGSPSIGTDGTVYIAAEDNGNVYAINPNGTQKWVYVTTSTSESSAAVGVDGTIYVGVDSGYPNYKGRVIAFNPDGTLQWSFDMKEWNQVYSSPTIAGDGTVYIGERTGQLMALRSASMGLANSSWPKFRKNSKNIGSLQSIVASPPDTTAPSPPTITSITPYVPVSPNPQRWISSITLQWNTMTNDTTYRRIWRKLGSGDWLFVWQGQGNTAADLNIGMGTYSYKMNTCSTGSIINGSLVTDNCGPDSNIVTTRMATDGVSSDTIPPSTPTDLRVWTVDNRNFMSWMVSTDNVGVAGYHIYRNGTYLKSVSTVPAEDDFLFSSVTLFNYTVAAYDVAGNISAQSSSASVATALSAPNFIAIDKLSNGPETEPPKLGYTTRFSYTLTPNTQSFIVYLKKPSDAAFVKYVYDAQAMVATSVQGASLSHDAQNYWYWSPSASLPDRLEIGDYKLYATVMSTAGVESPPSQTRSLTIYPSPTFTNPLNNASATSPFSISWTNGAPDVSGQRFAVYVFNKTRTSFWSTDVSGLSVPYGGNALKAENNPYRVVIHSYVATNAPNVFANQVVSYFNAPAEPTNTSAATTTATTTSLKARTENLAAISEVVGSLNAALDALIQLLKRF